MKRAFDIVVSFSLLLLMSPLLCFFCAAARVLLGSPVLFRQERSGLNGLPFRMIKFRTMTDDRCIDGILLPDSERLTRFGKWMRSTSVDELPELWNVLKGDMSLVGPRPLLMQYLDLYTAEQSRRHEVLPGITGWAQVNGRNAISWEEKFTLDVWYVDNRTMWLDCNILWSTIKNVIVRTDISAHGEATMPRFLGRSD